MFEASVIDNCVNDRIESIGNEIVENGGLWPDCDDIYKFEEIDVDPTDFWLAPDRVHLNYDDDNGCHGNNVDAGKNHKFVGFSRLSDIPVPSTNLAHFSVNKVGNICIDVKPHNLDYWESLDEFVSVDTSLESNVTYGKLYCCDKPVALIGVGPGCIAPVFEACINGTCSCIYVLCGVQCQLKPCRFASAVLGFTPMSVTTTCMS